MGEQSTAAERSHCDESARKAADKWRSSHGPEHLERYIADAIEHERADAKLGMQGELLESISALDAVIRLLEANGCDCDCDHGAEEHDEECYRCLGCKVSEVIE